MKILWFTNTPCSAAVNLSLVIKGGGWLYSLEKEISNREDIELHVAFYFNKEIEPFKYNNTHFYPIKRKYSGTKIERYFARLFKLEFNDKTEIKALTKIVDNVKPELIHVHGTEDNFGLIQYYTQFPVVVSIQGMLNPVVEKFYSGITSSAVNSFESLKTKLLIKSSNYKYSFLRRKAERELKILRISKYIIGRTEWDKRITRILAPESNYFVCQEMLRPSFYKYEWCKLQFSDKIRIITVSNDKLYKGFETIVKTVTILSAYPDFKFEWLVVGLNKKSNVVILTQNWLKLKIENFHIKLLGEKSEKDIANLLLSADIYCQVSHIENSPNSLCEAMMLGVPVIASFAGGTSSILKDGEEGVLVQDGDPYALAGAIIEMANNFLKAQQFSKCARAKSTERHNKEKITNDLVSLYRSLLIKNDK